MVSNMSLWSKYQSQEHFAKLTKDLEIDTLIIGGGITGLTTLYYLKEVESVCLVEAGTIGCGVTSNTTGKITYLQGAIYTEIQKNTNYETAKLYLKSQLTAINLLKDIINNEKIACDLEEVTAFLDAPKEEDYEKLIKEKEFFERNHIPVQLDAKNRSLQVNDTYVFNPIKYLNGLKKILKNKLIYEQTRITKIKKQGDGYLCFGDGLKIKAHNLVIACHYPFFLFPFCLPLKSYIEKSYIYAYKVTKNNHCTSITVSNPGYSTRYYQDGKDIYKICLDSSHHTAFKQNDTENFLKTKEKFAISEDKNVFKWSNVDIISIDKMPFIGAIKPNLFIASGFNTWGMTNSILAAKIISDAILNKENFYAPLFDPHRFYLSHIKNYLKNTFSSIYGFINSHIKKDWYSSKLTFKKENGQTIAIYTDENNGVHPVIPVCPHLKCGLIFNEEEKTWDCPCHSSRFDIDGKCLKGPSTKDITYFKEKD